MTTDEELKTLQAEYDSIKHELDNEDKLNELKLKITTLSAQRQNSKVPTDMGGQIKYWLVQHGLRRSFYLFIFGATLMDIGLYIPLSWTNGIPLYAIGFLIILYAIYEIPMVKAFLAEEIVTREKK